MVWSGIGLSGGAFACGLQVVAGHARIAGRDLISALPPNTTPNSRGGFKSVWCWKETIRRSRRHTG
jgi:hypothetical protein